jgi:hypothetical protein
MISGFFLKSTVVWPDNDPRVVFKDGGVVCVDNSSFGSDTRIHP